MNKLLKYLIIFLVVLAIAAIGLMFISPAQLEFEESETMDAPPTMVYNMVSDFKKWRAWSPWDKLDPDAEHSYTTKTAGVGAQWNWKGNEEIGEGSQTITEARSGEYIKTALKFGGWDGESYSDWKFENVGGKAKVTWGFEGSKTPFIMRPFNLLMKKGLTKTYREGLSSIRKIVEERNQTKVYNGYKINEVYLPKKNYVMNRQVVEIDKMDQFYSQNIASLFMKAQGTDMKMDGMPCQLFYNWDEAKGTTDTAAALPLEELVNVPGAISQTLPDSKAIQIEYLGSPEKMEEAHYAIADFMADHGLLVNYPIIHEYVTDPQVEKDPSKWLTKITYYIIKSSQ